jgi:hypothetical protein
MTTTALYVPSTLPARAAAPGRLGLALLSIGCFACGVLCAGWLLGG